MPDTSSFRFRIIESEASRMLTSPIAIEVQTICKGFCEPVQPGECRKSQLNRGWAAAGRPSFWRFRAGYYGEAGCWSAAAVRDFQTRYQAHLDREARRAEQAQAIERAKTTSSEPDYVRLARDEYQTLLQRVAALEAALRIRS